MKTFTDEDLYVVITWPEIQEYMDEPGFDENSYLVSDSKGMDAFGSGAYFVNKDWLTKIERK